MDEKKKQNIRHRLVIELEEEQKRRLERYFKWGDLSPFFRFLIDDLLELMEDPKSARMVMSAYIQRKIGLSDLTNMIPEDEDDNNL